MLQDWGSNTTSLCEPLPPPLVVFLKNTVLSHDCLASLLSAVAVSGNTTPFFISLLVCSSKLGSGSQWLILQFCSLHTNCWKLPSTEYVDYFVEGKCGFWLWVQLSSQVQRANCTVFISTYCRLCNSSPYDLQVPCWRRLCITCHMTGTPFWMNL